MYPYLVGSTALLALIPEWAQEGGKVAILKRLADSSLHPDMISSMESQSYSRNVEWDKVLISGSPRQRDYEGRFIADLAAEEAKSPHRWVFDALLETELNLWIIIFSISEENLKLQLRHPAMMIGTDGRGLTTEGPMSGGTPHPRSYGTFPRVLGHYVREEKIISMEEAIWKMSEFPMKKLGVKDRGMIKKDSRADLVVFDPDTIIDRATYEAPHQYSSGILLVIVNGKLVIHDGVHTGARPGVVLRRGRK